VLTLSDEVDVFRFWKREGDSVIQALGPPLAEVSEWIERLSLRELDGTDPRTLFDSSTNFLDLWSAAVSPPPPAAAARDWVAAMVFPRMPPCRVCSGPDWMYRWQVVALIGLAHAEPGWEGTQKRAALRSLLRGAIDWPLAAAIRVAAELTPPEVVLRWRGLGGSRAPTRLSFRGGQCTVRHGPYKGEHELRRRNLTSTCHSGRVGFRSTRCGPGGLS
jgi:hypothetical protein